MTPRFHPLGRVWAVLAPLAAVILGGCAAQFAVERPEEGPVLVGAIEPGAPPPGPGGFCDSMRVEVSVGYDPVIRLYPGGGQLTVGYLAGRAYGGYPEHLNVLERAVPALQPYTLEGDVYENGTAVVTLYRSTILPYGPSDAPGAKPFSVFRGTLLGDRLDLVEQPPSCERRLVADLGGAGATELLPASARSESRGGAGDIFVRR